MWTSLCPNFKTDIVKRVLLQMRCERRARARTWWAYGLATGFSCVTIGRRCRINRPASPLQMSLLLSSDTLGLFRINCFSVWKRPFCWTSTAVIFAKRNSIAPFLNCSFFYNVTDCQFNSELQASGISFTRVWLVATIIVRLCELWNKNGVPRQTEWRSTFAKCHFPFG